MSEFDDESTDPATEDADETPTEDYPWRTEGPETPPEQGSQGDPFIEGTDTTPSQQSREQRSETEPRASHTTTSGGNQRGEQRTPDEIPQQRSRPEPQRADGEPYTGSSTSLPVRVLLGVITVFRIIFHQASLGLQWLLPRVTGTTSKATGITGYFYPSELLRRDEEVVHAGNPSRWNYPVPYIVSWLSLLTAIVVTIAVPLGYGQPIVNAVTPSFIDASVPDKWWLAPLGLVAFAGVILFRQALTRGSTWYIITDSRILFRRNILFTEKSRIDMVNVNQVKDYYPFPQRLAGVGDVEVYTASTEGLELRLGGIKNPGTIANSIKHLEERNRGRQAGPSQANVHQQEQRREPEGRQEPSPHNERRHQASERPTRTESSESPPAERNPSDRRGDSIEDQRPDNSLRDDLDRNGDPFTER